MISDNSAKPGPKGRRLTASNSGFTLIELLVVIAIIGILASILFPVFGRARENARKSSCMSNMKQIGLGILQYTQDYDEKYFASEYGGAGGVPYTVWYDTIQPYLKSGTKTGKGGVFDCPSAGSPFALSYGVHADLFTGNPGGTVERTNSVTLIKNAAEKIILTENGSSGYESIPGLPVFISEEEYWTSGVGEPAGSKDDNDKLPSIGDCDDKVNDVSWECSAMPRYRHNGTANFLFADGHVKAMVRGRVRWYTNVYIQGAVVHNSYYAPGYVYDGENDSPPWYPWPY